MKKLSIAFFGAPDFAADVLRQIIEDKDLPVKVKLVVTQPDRPAGRKQLLTPTPVKLQAQKHNVPVLDSLKVAFSILHEVDLVLLYAYGKIIPKDMLNLPRWGFWNIHPSLLPLYRGPSPIVFPLLLGDKKTGVSLIQMDERMDNGPIIDQEESEINTIDTQDILRKRLSDIGYKLFKKNIQLLIDGALQKKEQDISKATFTRLLTKNDGLIPFPIVQKIIKGETITKNEIPAIITQYCLKYSTLATSHQSPVTYFNVYRALSPWPGLWTLLRPEDCRTSDGQALLPSNKRLKISKMEYKNERPAITHVQLEGKNEVDFLTFQKAYGLILNS